MCSYLMNMSLLWIGISGDWLRCSTSRSVKCKDDGSIVKCEIPIGLENRETRRTSCVLIFSDGF